jgi:hypothetical protein
MAKQLESIEIIPGESGGHRVVHNFKRETGTKSGAMNGGLYMERPKSDEHLFGASEEGKTRILIDTVYRMPDYHPRVILT